VIFYPDGEIFQTIEFTFESLATRLIELVFLNKVETIKIYDEKKIKKKKISL